jgi:hypothetical protein
MTNDLTFELVALQRLTGAELGVLRQGIPASEALAALEDRTDLGYGVITFLRAEGAAPTLAQYAELRRLAAAFVAADCEPRALTDEQANALEDLTLWLDQHPADRQGTPRPTSALAAAADALADAAREQLQLLAAQDIPALAAQDIPALADLFHAVEAYEAARGSR